MVKKIYMGKSNGHVNQRLANRIIDKQLPTWDKTNLYKYIMIYPILKAWIFLESDSHVLQQFTLSIKAKFNLIIN